MSDLYSIDEDAEVIHAPPPSVPNPGFEREMTCRTWGQYNFETFDGLYYHFPGRCTYTLLRDCEETTMASIVIQVRQTLLQKPDPAGVHVQDWTLFDFSRVHY